MLTSRLRSILGKLGPGLITGASDDDPSGIGTYAQVGAQHGFTMLWTMLFSYPLMVAIQLISARLGRVTGHGIAHNLRAFYPTWLSYWMVGLLLVANTINLGADLSAMAAAAKLLLDGSTYLYLAIFGGVSLFSQIFLSYRHYVRVIKWLTLSLFTYVGTVFAVHIPWATVLTHTLLPHFTFNAESVTAIVAILGTTISPYLFFWQASQEVEEQRDAPREKPLRSAPYQAPKQLGKIRLDTFTGMAVSNLIAFFIILTTAITLHQHGVTGIDSAAQAAQALKPVAGNFAFTLFALGIIGTGLLAIPVLAGSAAYAAGEALRWTVGLNHSFRDAQGFYGVIVFSTVVGAGMNLLHINPIKALFWASVLNGVIAVPVMIVMMLMTARRVVMADFTVTGPLKAGGWLATVVMTISVIAMLATMA